MSDSLTPLNTAKIHTLVDLFNARVACSPSQAAYRQYLPGLNRWHSFSWNELATRVDHWQRALAREQLAVGDRFAIMSSNRPEWIAADIAAQSLGMVVVALFSEDTAGNAANMLEHSGASALMLEDPDCWEDISRHQPLPRLKRVISLQAFTSEDARLVNLANWLDHDDSSVAPKLPKLKPDQLAVICYTSGTSGRPKGAMLTHRNILSNVIACHQAIPMVAGDVALSFLPLAHMFERTTGYYHAILAGAEVAFTRGLKHLSEDFREVRPTVLISVPRVFERFYSLIQRRVHKRPWLLRWLFRLARDAGWKQFEYQQQRAKRPVLYRFQCAFTRSVGRQVLDTLGGRVRLAVSGGAPLSPQIARTFIGLGLPLVQGYGLTEASPVVSTNRAHDNDPESVGKPLDGMQTRRSSNGELQVRGPSVMQGYWQDEAATAEALSEDGWLNTGDKISRLHKDRLFVVGRLKELIVMSNGEKAAPGLLEQDLKLDPIVEQVIIIGEARPYLAALIVPNPEILAEFCSEQKLQLGDLELLPALLKRLKSDLHNQPHFAQIRRIALMDEPWTTANGMLTPTHKPRRRAILQAYAERVDELYRGQFTPDDASLNYHVDIG
ncbi:MAG: AMP-dependent synthetase/ligase [Oceanococcus sp.]